MPNKVRVLFRASGMTVTELMRRSKLSMPTCLTAVNADDWPTEGTQWATIEAIANALGVNPRDIISNNGAEE